MLKYLKCITYRQIENEVQTVRYFVHREKEKQKDIKDKYFTKILEKLRSIKQDVSLSIAFEHNEINMLKDRIGTLKNIVFERYVRIVY